MRAVRAGRTWNSRCGRRRGPRRVAHVMRAGPTLVRRWRGSSESPRRGVCGGSRKSTTMRVMCRSGRPRVPKRVVDVTRASPTAVSCWGRSSERARRGVGGGLPKSRMRPVRACRISGRKRARSCVRRGVPRHVVLVTRASPTPAWHWGRSSEGARAGVRRCLRKSATRVVCRGIRSS